MCVGINNNRYLPTYACTKYALLFFLYKYLSYIIIAGLKINQITLILPNQLINTINEYTYIITQLYSY